MSLPSPAVLHCYIKLYIAIRDPLWNSHQHGLMNTVEKVIPVVPQVDQELQRICDNVTAEIIATTKVNTVNSWVNLIYKLSNFAEEAQNLKDAQPDNFFTHPVKSFTSFISPVKESSKNKSLCCEVLHGLRSYIIESLLSTEDAYKKEFQQIIADLKYQVEHIDKDELKHGERKKCQDDVLKFSGIEYGKLIKKLNEHVLNLALLGEPEYIKEAREKNLLLPTTENFTSVRAKHSAGVKYQANFAFPYPLQNKFCETVFMDELKATYDKLYNRNSDYESFLSDILEGQIEIQQTALANSEKARLAALARQERSMASTDDLSATPTLVLPATDSPSMATSAHTLYGKPTVNPAVLQQLAEAIQQRTPDLGSEASPKL